MAGKRRRHFLTLPDAGLASAGIVQGGAAMPFLILSRQGLADLQAAGPIRDALWLNPGLLSDSEVAQLRQQGITLSVLPQLVDPGSAAQRETAARLAGSATLWVEQAAGAAPGATLQTTLQKAQHIAQEQASKLARAAARRIRRYAAGDGAAIIVPYMSYGSADCLTLRGRVLKDEGFHEPDPAHSGLRNLVELYKRLGSDEVPGATLRAVFGGIQQDIATDDSGYFTAAFRLPQALAGGWHTVRLTLLDPAPRTGPLAQADAQVLVPPASARFGVISDIDDTVLWSNVTSKLRMLKMLAMSNAHTRKPFKGVTAFYRALHDGPDGKDGNPLFYVSSSPWHLYTPLVDFIESQSLPLGPLLLKELGVKSLFGAGSHMGHKLAHITQILDTYPALPFVLIGDSGQQDPEIYREVVQRYPQRIKAIYIRSVDPDPARIEAIDRLAAEVRSSGAQLVLAPDSEFAAAHAAGEGLIAAAAVMDVRADKRADKSPLPLP
jgi:phosphatidate phosphatase APP1